MKIVALALLMLVAAIGCDSSAVNDPVLGPDSYDEIEMQAAIDRARREVDVFIAELSKNEADSYSVKAPIKDGAIVEHFWLKDVTYKNGRFDGTIDNEPADVSNVKLGQRWSLAKNEISDWLYMKGGKMYGNYTLRPMLPALPPDEAGMLKAMLADP